MSNKKLYFSLFQIWLLVAE